MQGYDIRIPKLLGGLKTMRKTLSIVLSLLMVLSIFAPVYAEEDVKDVTAENIAKNEEFIDFLKDDLKIIEGDKSGDLMLDKDIDRASFAAILVRADGKDAVAKSVATLPSKFADMTAAHWANGYATVAHDNLWMKGDPQNNFMPGKSISYAEIATTLVRFMGEEKDGMVYPTSYIAKATELGLFKGTEEIAGEYTKNAVRKNVFMMLYNALSREDFGKYNVYEMIVLENSRVATLNDNQIKAEVLSVVQIANNVSERGVAKVGQQMVFDIKDVKVEEGLADTEYLMGKVAKFTVDENGKLVKVVVDHKNYDYLIGGMGADEKYVNLAGTDYAVRVDERYYNDYHRLDRDDRMYRTYLTTEDGVANFNYKEFARRLNLRDDDREKISANFGRITVKDGMVLFVDAYGLTDIAPVQKVERDGQDVYYYNDERNGAVERTIVGPYDLVLGFNAKDGIFNYDRKEIKTDDVIHWMNGFYLVRTDAKVEAKLDKTFVNRWGEFATLALADDKTIDRNLSTVAGGTIAPYRSVFAYDDNHFRRTENRGLLKDMVGSDVKVLLDVRNKIQLITSHEKFTDRIALVNKNVSAKGMEFYVGNAPEESTFRLTDGWDSNYYRRGWNRQQTNRFDYFNRLDLAHTSSDKDGNAKVVATIDGFEYQAYINSQPITSTFPVLYRNKLVNVNAAGRYSEHDWQYVSFPQDRRNIIKVGGKALRYTDETEVFVVNAYKNRGTWERGAVVKATMADVMKYDIKNQYLGAVALTEKEYADFLAKERIANYGYYSNVRGDFVKAIVFTNYTGPMAELENVEYGRVDTIYLYSNEVKIELRPGVFETFEIHDDSNLAFTNDVKPRDFVIFNRVKDAKKPTAVFTNRIVDKAVNPYDVEWTTRKVVQDRSAYDLTLVKDDVYKTDEVTVEFGEPRGNKIARVYAPSDKLADLVVYTANDGSADVKVEKPGIVNRLGDGFIVVDDESFRTTDETILVDENGNYLKVNKNLAPELKVGDKVVVESENGVATKVTVKRIILGVDWDQRISIPGVAPKAEVEEVQGEYTLTFTGQFHKGDRFVLDGTTLEVAADGDANTTANDIKAKIDAMDRFSATVSNNVITIKEEANKAEGNTPKFTVGIDLKNGNNAEFKETKASVKHEAEVIGTKQVVELEIKNYAPTAGTIKVRFTDGTKEGTYETEVAVKKGEKVDLAKTIEAAFKNKVTGWTVSQNSNNVLFTADKEAANNTNAKAEIID